MRSRSATSAGTEAPGGPARPSRPSAPPRPGAPRGPGALVAAALPRTADGRDAVESVVSPLGEASGVSRAYLCLNSRAPDGRVLTTCIHEWLAFRGGPGPPLCD